MIRFAWLQFRNQAAVVFGGLAVVAVILAITGPHLVHLYSATVATCAAHGDCSTATAAFVQNDRTLQILFDALVVVVPGIIGVFWGAPLVARELESGTFRLVWTQSVTRIRWAALKLGVVGLASIAAAGLLSLIVTWWSSPIDRANASLYTSFDQRGIVPLGYAAFAFVLGVLCGVLIRRTLPAMAITLAIFIAARLSFTHWIRPHLITPVQQALAFDPTNGGWGFGTTSGPGASNLLPPSPDIPRAWVLSTQMIDKAGHALSPQFVANACPILGQGGGGPSAGSGAGAKTEAPAGALQTLHNCVAKVGTMYHEVVAFQPASRYWSFQWFELAIYLGVALVLAGTCIWWVRHRLS